MEGAEGMAGTGKEKRMQTAIRKELALVEKQEEKLRKAAGHESVRPWGKLEEKIPQKIYENLEKAFCKAFSIVFDKGTGVIEKSYNKNAIQEDYQIRNYAVQVRSRRKELRNVKSGAQGAGVRNMAITTAEGIGLGIFGIGLPDIVIFTGVILKGIYETALHYGYAYDTAEERLLILKMMEAALSKGGEWEEKNQTVDEWLQNGIPSPEGDEMSIQMQETAQTFAMDMLVLKFIQGIPVAGMIGGAGNPVYYRKVMKYVQLKYRKRYLMRVADGEGQGTV